MAMIICSRCQHRLTYSRSVARFAVLKSVIDRDTITPLSLTSLHPPSLRQVEVGRKGGGGGIVRNFPGTLKPEGFKDFGFFIAGFLL
jgi:hypothetical protein